MWRCSPGCAGQTLPRCELGRAPRPPHSLQHLQWTTAKTQTRRCFQPLGWERKKFLFFIFLDFFFLLLLVWGWFYYFPPASLVLSCTFFFPRCTPLQSVSLCVYHCRLGWTTELFTLNVATVFWQMFWFWIYIFFCIISLLIVQLQMNRNSILKK